MKTDTTNMPEWKRKNLEKLQAQIAAGDNTGPEADLERLHTKGKMWCSPTFNKYYSGLLSKEEEEKIAQDVKKQVQGAASKKKAAKKTANSLTSSMRMSKGE